MSTKQVFDKFLTSVAQPSFTKIKTHPLLNQKGGVKQCLCETNSIIKRIVCLHITLTRGIQEVQQDIPIILVQAHCPSDQEYRHNIQ